MMYNEPTASILSILRLGEVTQVVLHLPVAPDLPLAPASLHDIHEPHDLLIELHKVAKQAGDQITFETYTAPDTLPTVGQPYIFRAWWMPEQLAAVIDTSRVWVREAYPDNGDHDHCWLTWETIAAYADHKEGYRSGCEWITVAAYNKYIRDDFLRVRGT
jgi:hypothetical protein